MYLCIDTISEVAGITLVSANFATYLLLDPKNSSEGIIGTIDQTLKVSKISLSDIKGILVIKGPGSFTGLRVGLTVANQFAHELKIPILGLRQDEWWLARTNEDDILYLQTMNKAEVYLSKDGQTSIEDVQNLSSFGPTKWLGQLSDDHYSWLSSNFEKLTELTPVKETWQKIIKDRSDSLSDHKIYELEEPFYGKDPAITKSKKIPLIEKKSDRNLKVEIGGKDSHGAR